ncbi:protein FAR1-RELATED SEQUENCE 5 isoform X1 [Vigna angularis]|nr:protein FAR1-RELATED SEQUENCE 5 isoform X1 [Vigna angularis]
MSTHTMDGDQGNDYNDNVDEPNESLMEIDPIVHMCFDSMVEAKTFYTNYAIRRGFAVRTRTSKKDKDNNVYYLRIVCSREGKYVSSVKPVVKTLPSQINQCPAGITIAKKEDKWFIRTVVLDHNHDLCPNNSKLFAANRKLSMHAKHTLQVNHDAGVRLNKSFLSIVNDAGGYENMDFVERDARNYIGQHRRSLCKDGDGQALLRHFSSMKDRNNEFFYDIALDEGNKICSVFWADARSRAACEEFGDVVSFDTTYLTNKYDMPFAPFVGVNHHGHSILLGCGLLSSEDTVSFVWLFQCWLRCMRNKTPQGIITDQCRAMTNAIEQVFPHTRHRWCLWHILKKLPEKLHGYRNNPVIKTELHALIYDCVCPTEFENGWKELLTKHGLEENEWLCNLYEERHKWVPCYLKKDFWAGMSTTQRSEGMNAFFDGFINSTTTLQQFVVQYDNALRVKAQKEIEADFSSMNTTIACGSQSPIERQFQVEYTHAKFEEVQTEFRSRMNCFIKDTLKEDLWNTYTVKEERMWEGNRVPDKFYKVQFDPITQTTTCSCHLFEFRGIICRHSLLVFGQEDVYSVPSQYILRRWSKNIRRRHTLITASYSNSTNEPRMQRYKLLCKRFYEIAEVACESEETSTELEKELNCLGTKFGFSSSMTNNIISDAGQLRYDNGACTSIPLTPVGTSDVLVHSPATVKRKGRPRTNRLKSTVEKKTKRRKSTSLTNTSTPPTEQCGERPSNVIECDHREQFEADTIQLSQDTEMGHFGFMSLLSAVHNNFDNNIN